MRSIIAVHKWTALNSSNWSIPVATCKAVLLWVCSEAFLANPVNSLVCFSLCGIFLFFLDNRNERAIFPMRPQALAQPPVTSRSTIILSLYVVVPRIRIWWCFWSLPPIYAIVITWKYDGLKFLKVIYCFFDTLCLFHRRPPPWEKTKQIETGFSLREIWDKKPDDDDIRSLEEAEGL